MIRYCHFDAVEEAIQYEEMKVEEMGSPYQKHQHMGGELQLHELQPMELDNSESDEEKEGINVHTYEAEELQMQDLEESEGEEEGEAYEEEYTEESAVIQYHEELIREEANYEHEDGLKADYEEELEEEVEEEDGVLGGDHAGEKVEDNYEDLKDELEEESEVPDKEIEEIEIAGIEEIFESKEYEEGEGDHERDHEGVHEGDHEGEDEEDHEGEPEIHPHSFRFTFNEKEVREPVEIPEMQFEEFEYRVVPAEQVEKPEERERKKVEDEEEEERKEKEKQVEKERRLTRPQLLAPTTPRKQRRPNLQHWESRELLENPLEREFRLAQHYVRAVELPPLKNSNRGDDEAKKSKIEGPAVEVGEEGETEEVTDIEEVEEESEEDFEDIEFDLLMESFIVVEYPLVEEPREISFNFDEMYISKSNKYSAYYH